MLGTAAVAVRELQVALPPIAQAGAVLLPIVHLRHPSSLGAEQRAARRGGWPVLSKSARALLRGDPPLAASRSIQSTTFLDRMVTGLTALRAKRQDGAASVERLLEGRGSTAVLVQAPYKCNLGR